MAQVILTFIVFFQTSKGHMQLESLPQHYPYQSIHLEHLPQLSMAIQTLILKVSHFTRRRTPLNNNRIIITVLLFFCRFHFMGSIKADEDLCFRAAQSSARENSLSTQCSIRYNQNYRYYCLQLASQSIGHFCQRQNERE